MFMDVTERSGFFSLSRSGPERIFAHRKSHGFLRSGYPSDGFFHGADCPLRRANRTNPLRFSTPNRIHESVVLDGYPRMLNGFLLVSETTERHVVLGVIHGGGGWRAGKESRARTRRVPFIRKDV